jgi:hypothetical protein
VTRRIIVDGVMWRVFEFLGPFYLPGENSLVFVSDDAWRLIRTFPVDWAARDDAALFALSAAAG